jgi:predicted AlkP superfamily phosphohydrolase/phosphomutase
MVSTEGLREELLMASLDRAPEWDVLFQVLSTPDRVGHMLFRESDPQHPLYDAELARTEVSAWGRTFPLEQALQHTYANVDRIVGRVLERIDSGALGPDCLLLVVSDHGFSSFRRQVNLNNALHELGYLHFTEGQDLESVMRLPGGRRDFLGPVDWTRTRAYSLGLGEVFVNLVGREPRGIVPPEEYDATIEALRQDLLALKDPRDGASVVTTVSRRDELYSGPWWKEGKASRLVRGEPVEVEHWGFADLFLGFAPYYRVAWGNTMGGFDDATVTDNDNHWSGDHVSVDPSHVPGVLVSNRRMAQPGPAHLADIAPTMLARYGIDPAPPATEMDGRVLPIEGLTR